MRPSARATLLARCGGAARVAVVENQNHKPGSAARPKTSVWGSGSGKPSRSELNGDAKYSGRGRPDQLGYQERGVGASRHLRNEAPYATSRRTANCALPWAATSPWVLRRGSAVGVLVACRSRRRARPARSPERAFGQQMGPQGSKQGSRDSGGPEDDSARPARDPSSSPKHTPDTPHLVPALRGHVRPNFEQHLAPHPIALPGYREYLYHRPDLRIVPIRRRSLAADA